MFHVLCIEHHPGSAGELQRIFDRYARGIMDVRFENTLGEGAREAASPNHYDAIILAPCAGTGRPVEPAKITTLRKIGRAPILVLTGITNKALADKLCDDYLLAGGDEFFLKRVIARDPELLIRVLLKTIKRERGRKSYES